MRDVDWAQLYERTYPPGQVMPPHVHDFGKISLVLDGSLLESAGPEENVCGAFDVVVKPPGVEHADRIGDRGARVFTVRFRPEFLADAASLAAGKQTYRWERNADLVQAACELWRTFRVDGDLADDAPTALLGALEEANHREGRPPAWLGAVTDRLEAEFAEPHAVADLALLAAVHPVHLSRVFRRHHRCTISTWLRRRRVREAAALMERTDLALSAIAVRCGFADQPHLTRSFKLETGFSPAAWGRATRT